AFHSFADDTGWTCAHVAGTATCDLDDPLAAGDTVSFTLSVWALDSLFDSGTFTPTSVTNVATVETSTDETDDTNNDDSTEVDVVAIDLVVTKDANVTHTQAGHTVIYTLEVSNVGDGLARANTVQLEDYLPSAVAF